MQSPEGSNNVAASSGVICGPLFSAVSSLVSPWVAVQASQPDRLGAQPGADKLGPGTGTVVLVEQRVEDRENGGEPVGQQMRGWYPVRDADVVDLPLGPDQALGHRLFGHQERAGGLDGGQPRQGAQPERDLRLERQRRDGSRRI